MAMSATSGQPTPRICSHAKGCELFGSFTLPGSTGVWRILYCEGDFEHCARFKLAAEGRPLPATLLPNGKTLRSFAPDGEPPAK
jgi:hypothetical protein